MQISRCAFGQVRVALSAGSSTLYTGRDPGFAGWRATVDRLTGFHKAIALGTGADTATHPGIAVSSGRAQATLELDHVELDLPNGQPLLSNASLTIARGCARPAPGRRPVAARAPCSAPSQASGPSGAATSAVPKRLSRVCSCPQRPYFPLGTLRCASWLYPAASDAFSDDEVIGVPHRGGSRRT